MFLWFLFGAIYLIALLFLGVFLIVRGILQLRASLVNSPLS